MNCLILHVCITALPLPKLEAKGVTQVLDILCSSATQAFKISRFPPRNVRFGYNLPLRVTTGLLIARLVACGCWGPL